MIRNQKEAEEGVADVGLRPLGAAIIVRGSTGRQRANLFQLRLRFVMS
jgi:hypothetical protein